jgi:hypothetical protein
MAETEKRLALSFTSGVIANAEELIHKLRAAGSHSHWAAQRIVGDAVTGRNCRLFDMSCLIRD